MKDEMKNLPVALWNDMTDEEWHYLLRTSFLPPRLKIKYYRLMDIQNPPPGPIEVFMQRDDLDRMIAEAKKKNAPR